MTEIREGYTEELGSMVYKSLLESPEVVREPFFLLPEEQTKQRLRNMDWVVGAYKKGAPVAAWWGMGEDISVIADPAYRGKWLTRSALKDFFDWFYSKYKVAHADGKFEKSYKMLVKLGFQGDRNNMTRNA